MYYYIKLIVFKWLFVYIIFNVLSLDDSVDFKIGTKMFWFIIAYDFIATIKHCLNQNNKLSGSHDE